MASQIQKFDPSTASHCKNEPDVEVVANDFLKSLGFTLKHRKTENKDIDKHWPSKTSAAKGPGAPDILIYSNPSQTLPFAVWENKSPSESVETALEQAQFYVSGLHQAKPKTPGLPRVAAGFNGKEIRISYFNHSGLWQTIKANGNAVIDSFPEATYTSVGFSSNGNFLAAQGHATALDLRNVLPTLKNIYRGIPNLKTGRVPIDFTIAILTLRMLCEMLPAWGSWAEQPGLVHDADTIDHALRERFQTLLSRISSDKNLKAKYGDIFEFSEKSAGANAEMAFSFSNCLENIPSGAGFYERIYLAIDTLPPLHGAEFDVFGEVYQAIGDDATKKALGEFFTGRHIISAVVPLLFKRAGITSITPTLQEKTIADIACGTGGFLTETLRYIKKEYHPSEETIRLFAERAFYGFDLSQSNASRARVNMYFAGDGFSTILGGVNSLEQGALPKQPKDGFDFMLANPPYGQRLEEAFLKRIVDLLAIDGWGLVVLPTGVLENPRSAPARLNLLKQARITDVIALPAHAFAPYTKQRTAIIIFQKRAKAKTSSEWKELVKDTEHEEIGMFIVDNDGYANSDKRYETNLKAKNGQWLHDDLKSWINTKTGVYQESKLLAALINKVQPAKSVSEFGAPLPKKYGAFTVKQLFSALNKSASEQARGVALLPDLFLRPARNTLKIEEFQEKCELANSLVTGKSAPTPGEAPLSEIIKSILTTPVEFSGAKKSLKIKTAFEITKGDTSLTEAVIYAHQDDDGLSVYGGGEALPRFKIKRATKTKNGATVTIHKGPCIIVAMDGSAGAIRVIESQEFVCNHHATVLKPKAGSSLDLHAVAQQIEGGLKFLASNKEGSATLTKPALEEFQFILPEDPENIKILGEGRKKMASIWDNLFGR